MTSLNEKGQCLSRSAKRVLLLGMGIAGFLGCLDLTIVNTALPAIQVSLGASVAALQWVMTTLLLALTAFMVIAGKLGDIYGRRLCLYIGLILFALSSLGAGLSSNISILIASRFLQGISIAFLYTAPVALLTSTFSVAERGRAMGILVAANGCGLALGPVLGGFIVSGLGWRWIFFINPPLVLLSLILCWSTLSESKMEEGIKKIDWLGGILLAVLLPAFVVVIVQGGAWGWLSLPIIGLFLFTVMGSLIFYLVEQRVKAPIIEFHLFTQRVFLVALSTNFALAFFYAIDFFLIPLYLHFVRGQASYEIGLMLLPATAMVTLFSSVTGRIVDKRGPKNLLIMGLGLCCFTAFLQAQFGVSTLIYLILFTYFIFGIAWACILSPSVIGALSMVSKDSIGVAMGTIGTLHNLGGVIGLAFGTLVYGLGVKAQFLAVLPDSGRWIGTTVADTDTAIKILMTHTELTLPQATEIFNNAFLRGYHWAMCLLIVIAATALLGVVFGYKQRLKNANS